MEKQKSSVRYAPEVRARAVRMVLEHGGSHASTMGSDRVDRREDRLFGRDAAQMGAARRSGTTACAGRSDERGQQARIQGRWSGRTV